MRPAFAATVSARQICGSKLIRLPFRVRIAGSCRLSQDRTEWNGRKERTAVTFRADPFRAAWWLPGPHAQTVAGRFVRPRVGVAFRRERVDTPDGDFLDL